MARKPAETTQLNTWDEQLAKDAAVASKMEESTATGNFFSTKGGRLSFNDNRLPNDEMAVVILDHVLENIYFESAYDAENPQGPTCFAFGREEKLLEPHEVVEQKQHDTCKGCPMNEWGSAERGRGKACRNIRRLAVISAGTLDKDGRFEMHEADQFEKNQIAYLKIPVTSTKAYAAYVKQVASALGRPPYAVFTKIKLVEDDSDQFHVTFEVLNKVPDKLAKVITARHNEAVDSIMFPYVPFDGTVEEKPAKKAPAKKGPAKKGPAKKRF